MPKVAMGAIVIKTSIMNLQRFTFIRNSNYLQRPNPVSSSLCNFSIMKSIKYLLPILSCVIVLAFTSAGQKSQWELLFNGKDLKGWDTYIGPDLNDSGKFISALPIGLNNDPRHVFTIVKVDGENLIRISGENWGAITTVREYENYHLQLQFKWGALTWGQKKGKKKDSGLLYHSIGKWGADYGAWMRSQEFQIEETNTGDYWGVAGGMADMPVIKKSETEYDYNPKGEFMTFKEGGNVGRRCFKSMEAENPTGQWNTLDLYCHGDTSMHVVNGKVVMILYRNRQNDNGNESPLSKGKIQIQSEGAEVFYRQIKIQPIAQLPAEFVN
jgi:hypothetical protein